MISVNCTTKFFCLSRWNLVGDVCVLKREKLNTYLNVRICGSIPGKVSAIIDKTLMINF